MAMKAYEMRTREIQKLKLTSQSVGSGMPEAQTKLMGQMGVMTKWVASKLHVSRYPIIPIYNPYITLLFPSPFPLSAI